MNSEHAERILAERARLLARIPTAPPAADAQLEVAAFPLAGEHLAVPTTGVREIQPLRAHRWTRVPCAPAFVAGLVNLRGRLFSIVDLAPFWGRPAHRPTEAAHLLLVRGGRNPDGQPLELALLTDSVPVVMALPAASLELPPPTVSAAAQEHVRAVTAEALIVLDLDRLLSDPRLIVLDEP